MVSWSIGPPLLLAIGQWMAEVGMVFLLGRITLVKKTNFLGLGQAFLGQTRDNPDLIQVSGRDLGQQLISVPAWESSRSGFIDPDPDFFTFEPGLSRPGPGPDPARVQLPSLTASLIPTICFTSIRHKLIHLLALLLPSLIQCHSIYRR